MALKKWVGTYALYCVFLQEMDLGNVEHACLVLTILSKYGEMLVFPGGGGISVIVAQGFVKKISELINVSVPSECLFC